MKLRKILSLALALALCAGLLIVPAGAYGTGNVWQYSSISAESAHTAAIDANGSLWTWGAGDSGQLGNGTTEDSAVPVKVMDNVVCVSCGTDFTAAIDANGSLWMWGYGGSGQLGNGAEEDLLTPTKIMDNVIAVSCGEAHTAVIKTDGTLWMWGNNSYGTLGNGSEEDSSRPVKVMDSVTAVSCGWRHTAAIDTEGNLWTWGAGDSGQLGNGSKEGGSNVPIKVMDEVAFVSCGRFNTAAINIYGSLWLCGTNNYGQIGNRQGSPGDYRASFVKVLSDVSTVSCGGWYTAAIKKDGTLWTWGHNSNGELGSGSRTDSNVPVQRLEGITAISSGTHHIVACKADGSLWAWGRNEDGGLGYEGGNAFVNSWGDSVPVQTSPRQIPDFAVRTADATVVPPAPAIAYPTDQLVELDGNTRGFLGYALMDENGNETNYIRLRDLAMLLRGTNAQFEVGWDGAVAITTGTAYTPNGTEDDVPFSGPRFYTPAAAATKVNGQDAQLSAFVLTDDQGGGYTYYKLRDLGAALGFHVDWSVDRGVFIETK